MAIECDLLKKRKKPITLSVIGFFITHVYPFNPISIEGYIPIPLEDARFRKSERFITKAKAPFLLRVIQENKLLFC